METITTPAEFSPALQKAMLKAISLDEFLSKTTKAKSDLPDITIKDGALKDKSQLNTKYVIIGLAILAGVGFMWYKIFNASQEKNTKPTNAENLQSNSQSNPENSNTSPQHTDENSIRAIYGPHNT